MVMSAFDFDLDEVRVLDAFGGSGALGIEMLSRGARSLTTFEIDRNAARLITKNIESLCRDRARWRVVTVTCWQALRAAACQAVPLTWFCSTRPMLLAPSRSRSCWQNLAQQGLLAQGAYALFEHAAADTGAHPTGFETVREKRYGITSVDLLRWSATNEAGNAGDSDHDDDSLLEDAHE